jgi:hypothetical protein
MINHLKTALVVLGLVSAFVWGAALHSNLTEERIQNAFQQGMAQGFVTGLQVGVTLNPKAPPQRTN